MLTLAVTVFLLGNPFLLTVMFEGLLGAKKEWSKGDSHPENHLCICVYLLCGRALLAAGQRSSAGRDSLPRAAALCLLLCRRTAGRGPAPVMSEGRSERRPRTGCHHQNYPSDHKLTRASVTNQLSWQAGCRARLSGAPHIVPAEQHWALTGTTGQVLSLRDVTRPFPTPWFLWTSFCCRLDTLSRACFSPGTLQPVSLLCWVAQFQNCQLRVWDLTFPLGVSIRRWVSQNCFTEVWLNVLSPVWKTASPRI